MRLAFDVGLDLGRGENRSFDLGVAAALKTDLFARFDVRVALGLRIAVAIAHAERGFYRDAEAHATRAY